MIDPMLLVVLGAGASYDSADGSAIEAGMSDAAAECRPPLAKQLFETRPSFGSAIDELPDCRSLVVQLRAVLADSNRLLERELDVLSAAATNDPRAATQLMAIRYYLQHILSRCADSWSRLVHGCTNYHYLVERLDQWARQYEECVVYVTFNYDDLLERAIKDVLKQPFRAAADYTSHPRAKVFKLHGSVDWAHMVDVEPIPGRQTLRGKRQYVIDHAYDLEIPSAITVQPGTETRGEMWVPALAVPIESKEVFECPADHVNLLDELLSMTDRLMVVGWRGTEKHFLKMLADRQKTWNGILVACASSTESSAVIGRIGNAQGGMRYVGYANWESDLGFSDLVANEELERFLDPNFMYR